MRLSWIRVGLKFKVEHSPKGQGKEKAETQQRSHRNTGGRDYGDLATSLGKPGAAGPGRGRGTHPQDLWGDPAEPRI